MAVTLIILVPGVVQVKTCVSVTVIVLGPKVLQVKGWVEVRARLESVKES